MTARPAASSAGAPVAGSEPLAGIRVFDLTRVLAGPFCTMVLADLGAEVIKVEGPDSPDYTRSIPPFEGDMSHYFLAVNRNKKSLALDLKSPEGRALGLKLALASDVVVENFRAGVLKRLGLDYETLRSHKPDIIVCSISGFGQTGSLSGKASVDTVVQALSGAMSVTGSQDGPPMKLGPAFGDLAGSMWAAIGVLAALHRRSTTGRGEHIDVALLDGLIGTLAYLAELYLVTGTSPSRVGNNHPTVPAYGLYEVEDGHIVLAAQMDSFWQNFCRASGRPDLADDARFATVADRFAHYAEVERIVSEIMRTKPLAEWRRLLDAADVPSAPVLSVGEALEQAHAVERGLVREIDQPGVGRVRVPGPTVKFLGDESPTELRHAPSLGEHTRAVLRDVAGLGATEIDDLLARRIAYQSAGRRVATA
ncbi:MAG: CoA transferase [Chloroflexota bacterium]